MTKVIVEVGGFIACLVCLIIGFSFWLCTGEFAPGIFLGYLGALLLLGAVLLDKYFGNRI